MYMKLSFEDLNPSPCPPHPISTYTCGVTITTRVCDDNVIGEFYSTYHIYC